MRHLSPLMSSGVRKWGWMLEGPTRPSSWPSVTCESHAWRQECSKEHLLREQRCPLW